MRTLHIKPRDLWPVGGKGSVINVGGVSVKFQSGKRGRTIKVTSKRHKPRHQIVDKRG